FRDSAGREHTVRVSGSLHANSGDFIAQAAVHGAGILLEPAFVVAAEGRAGRLIPLLQEVEPAPLPVYAVYPSGKHLSAKVRLFVDFLVKSFEGTRDWDLG